MLVMMTTLMGDDDGVHRGVEVLFEVRSNEVMVRVRDSECSAHTASQVLKAFLTRTRSLPGRSRASLKRSDYGTSGSAAASQSSTASP